MRLSSQSGIALILGIPIILTIAAIAYGIIGLGIYYRDKTKLKGALDVSLLGAAAEICSSTECFNNSRTALVSLLSNNLPDYDLSFVNLEELNDDGSQKTFWETDEYSFEINRGRWGPRSNTLESVEGDWENKFTGATKEFVYFGIQSSLTKKLSLPFSNILPFELKIRASGTSVVSLPKEQCVAPFAIPLCSLLDQSGNFNEKTTCSADRLFTQADRFCSTDSEEENSCGRVPTFSYDPEHAEYINDLDDLFDLYYRSREDNYVNEFQCFMATPWYKKRSQHFGVVGLPGDKIPNESLLKIITSTGNGCIKTSIGQPFTVLDEGITSSSLAEVIWDQISNAQALNSMDSVHPAFNQITNNDRILVNSDYFFKTQTNNPLCEIDKSTRPEFGTLGSFRHGFGFWQEFEDRIKGPNIFTDCPHQDDKFKSPFWKAKVPVIANMSEGAPTCAGARNQNRRHDPIVSSEIKYEIVGFATVHIYDIGVQGISWDGFPLASKSPMCAGIHAGVVPKEKLPEKPFTFKDYRNEIPKSYVVRGRLNCNAKSFTSYDDTLPLNEPVILN